MKKENFTKIYLMALSEPEFSRVDYWKSEQTNSKYSKENFIRKLISAHEDLVHRIDVKLAEFKALNPDAGDPNYGLPLVYETDNELAGHVRISDLKDLSKSLIKLAESFEIFDKKPMPFKITPELIERAQTLSSEYQRKTNKPLFENEVEVMLWLSGNPEILVKTIDSQLKEIYNSNGMEAVLNLRDNYLKKLEFIKFEKESGSRHEHNLNEAEELFKIIIRRVFEFETNPKKSTETLYREMRKELESKYQKEESDLWENHKSGKGIADHLVEYLKGKYPNAEKYPSESTIRKDWLKLTS